mmetsp:Transcript_122484/g.341378  ORF Transcript_122484/g.341378 Transcript_122484/m.341378 type:complete len:211 (-) Transcript_122484:372-1004(-)
MRLLRVTIPRVPMMRQSVLVRIHKMRPLIASIRARRLLHQAETIPRETGTCLGVQSSLVKQQRQNVRCQEQTMMHISARLQGPTERTRLVQKFGVTMKSPSEAMLIQKETKQPSTIQGLPLQHRSVQHPATPLKHPSALHPPRPRMRRPQLRHTRQLGNQDVLSRALPASCPSKESPKAPERSRVSVHPSSNMQSRRAANTAQTMMRHCE